MQITIIIIETIAILTALTGIAVIATLLNAKGTWAKV